MNPLSESDLGEGGFYFSTDYGLVFIWEYGNPGSVPMIGVNDEVQQLKLKSRSDTHMAKSEVGDEVGFVYASAEYTVNRPGFGGGSNL